MTPSWMATFSPPHINDLGSYIQWVLSGAFTEGIPEASTILGLSRRWLPRCELSNHRPFLLPKIEHTAIVTDHAGGLIATSAAECKRN